MDQIRKDLDQVMIAVENLSGAMHFLSQRVAWSETCFTQVQDSGVMNMAEAIRKVMEDHRKLQSQISMLSIRLTAIQGQGAEGESDGSPQKIMGKPSTNKFGS